MPEGINRWAHVATQIFRVVGLANSGSPLPHACLDQNDAIHVHQILHGQISRKSSQQISAEGGGRAMGAASGFSILRRHHGREVLCCTLLSAPPCLDGQGMEFGSAMLSSPSSDSGGCVAITGAEDGELRWTVHRWRDGWGQDPEMKASSAHSRSATTHRGCMETAAPPPVASRGGRRPC